MKMRTLSLALLLLLAILTVSPVYAQEPGEPPEAASATSASPEETLEATEAVPAAASGGLTFDLSAAGVLTISGTGPLDLSGWTGNENDVRSVVVGSGVTSVPEDAFRSFPLLASADIAGTVQSIGGCAFYNCERLERVTIRPGVQSIGASAFSGCSALSNVYLPSSLQALGESVFYGCCSMASANIPAGVTALPDRAFAGCSGLTSISVPDSVNTIGAAAFSRCSGLTAVTLPDSVKTIGSSAFSGCSALEEVRLPAGLMRIESETFRSCGALRSISFPSGLSFIGEYAFRESGLTSVTVPGNLTLEDGVFYDCERLETAALAGPPASLGIALFYSCSALTSVSLPEGLVSVPAYTFYLCESLRSVNIPGSVTEIRTSAFENCRELTELGLPGGLASIESRAFSSCGLTGLALPEGLSAIGTGALLGCSSLRELDLPESLASLGDGAFEGCLRLTWVSLPAGIGESVPENLFSRCSSLTAVSIPGTVQRVSPNAFQGCESLRTVLFGGTQEEWTHYVAVDPQNNDALSSAAVYFQGQFPVLYTVTVTGSEATVTGAGRYPAGTDVTLFVRNPYMGTAQTFDHWEIEGVSPPDSGIENLTFTMPAGNVSAVVKWRETLYGVQVSGSYAERSGEGDYPAGAAVSLHAGERPGYVFTAWDVSGVTLEDRFDPDAAFTMPANRVTAAANWQMLGYSLFVHGSYSSNPGQGAFPLGHAVTLRAGTRSGYIFDGWTVEGVTLSPGQLASPELTFSMPANTVTATARWRVLPLSVSRQSALVLSVANGGSLPGGAAVLAASLDAGRLTDVVQGDYQADSARVVFTRAPEGRRTLFFLDPDTFIPLAKPVILE